MYTNTINDEKLVHKLNIGIKKLTLIVIYFSTSIQCIFCSRTTLKRVNFVKIHQMHVFIKIHRISASQSKNFSLVVTSGWQPSPRVYFFANLGVIKMNGNNIYSGNQHHKKCFSDGCCKTLIYIVCVHIYSVRAVFTYWYIYMDIYDIPEKL
jgi:hypothetical protein